MGVEEAAETPIDVAVRLGRDPLLREIAALKEELAARKGISPCGVCIFRGSLICRRCSVLLADNPKKVKDNKDNKDGKDNKDNNDDKDIRDSRVLHGWPGAYARCRSFT
jgi:hypothetical protein